MVQQLFHWTTRNNISQDRYGIGGDEFMIYYCNMLGFMCAIDTYFKIFIKLVSFLLL